MPIYSALPPAVILAGGLGTRLRPVLPDTPKPMAPVAGKPFLQYQLEWLRQNGVRSVIVCVGYKKEQIMGYFGNGDKLNMALNYSVEPTPLGTAGALARAASLLPDEFLVINGDTYATLSLAPLWQAHHRYGGTATMVVTGAATGSNACGRVQLSTDNRVISFLEKEPGSGLVNMGIYACSRHVLQAIPSGKKVSLETDVFPKLTDLYGYCTDLSFIDIGTPAGYALANEYLGSLREGVKKS